MIWLLIGCLSGGGPSAPLSLSGVSLGDEAAKHDLMRMAPVAPMVLPRWQVREPPNVGPDLEVFVRPPDDSNIWESMYGPYSSEFGGDVDLGPRWQEPRKLSVVVAGAMWFGVRDGIVLEVHMLTSQRGRQNCSMGLEIFDQVFGSPPREPHSLSWNQDHRWVTEEGTASYNFTEHGFQGINSYCQFSIVQR